MPRRTDLFGALLVALLPAALPAQGRDWELHVGRWYNGNRANVYELRTSTRLTGPLTHGFGVGILVNDSLGRRRAFYGMGYEIQGWRSRSGFGPYALAGVALGLSTDPSTQQVAAQWSVGGGLEWRPFSWLAVGSEARYRLEDRGPRGFWNPASDDRSGISAVLGVTIGLGKGAGAGGRRPGVRGESGEREQPSERAGGQASPATGGVPRLPPVAATTVTVNATDVVETAVESLGIPYAWGGTAGNGFDCSGLIQYAYGQHGIRLPRISRDQAKAGAEVAAVVDALRPGDILLFSASPGAGVTHVGLYVGALKFIHSATAGVKLSLLDPRDPAGAYWLDRWVGVRRVIP